MWKLIWTHSTITVIKYMRKFTELQPIVEQCLGGRITTHTWWFLFFQKISCGCLTGSVKESSTLFNFVLPISMQGNWPISMQVEITWDAEFLTSHQSTLLYSTIVVRYLIFTTDLLGLKKFWVSLRCLKATLGTASEYFNWFRVS